MLHHGQRLTSIESGRSSRVGVLVGQGGFGQVLLATRLGSADHVPTTVCIKASTRQDGWLREAHFERLREKGVRIARAEPSAVPAPGRRAAVGGR
ncbi:MAG: hypothetical protein KA371_13930 [Acidobacteria bacterium]|nr:hypothetical protein [Acidobacteriota bacterium]